LLKRISISNFKYPKEVLNILGIMNYHLDDMYDILLGVGWLELFESDTPIKTFIQTGKEIMKSFYNGFENFVSLCKTDDKLKEMLTYYLKDDCLDEIDLTNISQLEKCFRYDLFGHDHYDNNDIWFLEDNHYYLI
jgi:hypothetical protein